MGSKFDIVFANGCSFVQGSGLNHESLPSVPLKDVPGRFSKLVAEHFNASEINLAAGGAGNDKIFRTTMEWIDNNSELAFNSKILFCFGLTYPQRSEIYLNKTGRYTKLNIYDEEVIAERVSKEAKFMTQEQVIELAQLWLVESYNEDERIKHHARLFKGMLAYLEKKSPNSEIFVFNSMGDYPEDVRTELGFDNKFNPSWSSYVDASNFEGQTFWHPQEEAHKDMANYIISKYE